MHENEFKGDLTAESGKVYEYEEVTGNITSSRNASFPKLRKVGGYVYVDKGATLQAEALTSVGGDVSVREGATLQAEALTSVGGYVSVREGATLQAEALTSVGGDVYVDKGATWQAEALTAVGGYVYVDKGATLQAEALTSVGGDVSVREGATWQAEALTSVGGDVSVREGATWQAEALTSVGGYVYVDKGATCRLQKNPKCNDPEAPRLTAEVHRYCRASLLSSFAEAGYSFADGILARIVSERGPVSRVVICGKTEVSYLVTDGEAWSHGKTLAEARDGLLFKIGKRDTSEFKMWTLDKEVSKRDAIRAYRIITGACEGGVRAWMEQRATPEKITVAGIIEITKGAYGSEAFAQFFSNKSEGETALIARSLT